MKRALIATLCIALMTMICACDPLNPSKIGSTTIFVDKEGKVTETVVEDFSMPQYSQDELNTQIAEEMAAYNATAGEDTVTLEYFTVENSIVKTQMTFRTAADYAAFNNVPFFNGTIADALAAGYTLDVILKNPANEDETIGIHEILTMQDKNVLIIESATRLRTESKILYVSEDTVIIDDYEVDAFENADATVIIY